MKSTLIGILTMVVSMAYCFETVEYLLQKFGEQAMALVEEVPAEEDESESKKVKDLSPDEFDGIHFHDCEVHRLSSGINFSEKSFIASTAYCKEIFSPPKAL